MATLLRHYFDSIYFLHRSLRISSFWWILSLPLISLLQFFLFQKQSITFHTYFHDTLEQNKFSVKTSENSLINVIIAFKNTENDQKRLKRSKTNRI